MRRAHIAFTAKAREIDRPLLDRLEIIGLEGYGLRVVEQKPLMPRDQLP